MNPKIAGVWLSVLLLGAAGCEKKSPAADAAVETPRKPGVIELVPEAERSRHFAAVSPYLELGGTLYGYADIDGDPAKLATTLHQLGERLAANQPDAAVYLKQDYAQLFTELGLTDVKALGFSSVPAGGGGFRNRAFFYTPSGRHGLLAGLGGPAVPFKYLQLAPTDTDFYNETELDLPAVYAAIRAVVVKVGGETAANAMDDRLKKAGTPAGLSAYSFIEAYKGRTATVLRLDPIRNLAVPGPAPVMLPAFSLLLRLDGVGAVVEPTLAGFPMLARSDEGAVHFYSLQMPLPLEGVRPVFAVEGPTLYFATTKEFLTECHQRLRGLEQDPDVQRGLAAMGRAGNGLTYVSPRLFPRLRQLSVLNRGVSPQVKSVIDAIAQQVPAGHQALMSVRINQPDGILIRSFWNRSLKQEVAMTVGYNPVTLGLVAAMAIPAFQKVRSNSQEKAILNNLRQLAAAADQYYLENGVNVTTYDKIVGPAKYIKALTPVMGENYRALEFKQGATLRVQTADGRTVEYKP